MKQPAVFILAFMALIGWSRASSPAMPVIPTNIFNVTGSQLPPAKAENDLPNNILQAIGQTEDGYLWIGTREGLMRLYLLAIG